jgi:hypothetical protein
MLTKRTHGPQKRQPDTSYTGEQQKMSTPITTEVAEKCAYERIDDDDDGERSRDDDRLSRCGWGSVQTAATGMRKVVSVYWVRMDRPDDYPIHLAYISRRAQLGRHRSPFFLFHFVLHIF